MLRHAWVSTFVWSLGFLSNGQNAALADQLGTENGFLDFQAGGINLRIVRDSQTLASLQSPPGFDFLPFDFLENMAFNGAHHLGDITFRYKLVDGGDWIDVDSASKRKQVKLLDGLGPGVLAGSDLGPTLPSGIPLSVTREWLSGDNGLALRLNFTNTADTTVEIGALGLPIIINNVFSKRTAEEIQAKCSLADPCIGLDSGYVRVSPVKGVGNALVISPLGSSPMEAWRFLREPAGNYGYQSQTFEGNYEWMIHSKAWADKEWKNAQPWNTPTSKDLKPGETYSIRSIEETVAKSETPLAVGIPGFVVPSDLTARLYITHSSPIKSIDSRGAFVIDQDQSAKGKPYLLTPTENHWGRANVTITYEDGKVQAVHYLVTKPAPQVISDLGHFLTTAAHYADESDPFGRAPSIMTYDRELNRIVEQDQRVWIAGLSDEGGTGAYVAAAAKLFIQPVAREVKVIDDFIHDTIVGTIQPPGSFGVRASTFFYEPNAVNYTYNPALDWTTWAAWNKQRAYTVERAYNYVHPVVAYWSMYRVARDYPQANTRSEWSWYLNRAYNTVQFCLSNGAADCGYGLTGLMGETVFAELLKDLKRENMTQEAEALKDSMRFRAKFWDSLAVPFGSEMAWDSTGQEGVYYWSNYFGYNNTATKAINSIVAYMPTVAHWGWNGNARRYWDFNYGAKHGGTERQIHHYGSGLNSLPMLHHFERDPTDFNAIRIGWAGNTAPLTNIDQEGFPSAAFHSFPEHMEWDPYTGDYGGGFLGLCLGQAMYIVNHDLYGDVVFGGNIAESNETVVIAEPRDALRRRIFVAELGLKISLSTGVVQSVTYDRSSESVKLQVLQASSKDSLEPNSTIVWLEQTLPGESRFAVSGAAELRGGYGVSFSKGQVEVIIGR